MAGGNVGIMAPERRRVLLETAAREFAAVGYEQASLNRIIRSCRMSKSSFYHYVSSKQELFELVVTDLSAAMGRALEVPAPAQFEGERFWARVAELFDQVTVLAQREPRFTDLGRMVYLPGAPSGEGSALRRVLGGVEAWIEDVLVSGRRSGVVRDDMPKALQSHLTIAVLRALDEWTLSRQDEFGPEEGQRLVRAQFDAIRRLLAR